MKRILYKGGKRERSENSQEHRVKSTQNAVIRKRKVKENDSKKKA